LLDQPVTSLNGVPPVVARAYQGLRAFYDTIAQAVGVPIERQITDYLPRTWDKDKLVYQLQLLEKRLATDPSAAPELAKVQTALGKIGQGLAVPWSVLPNELKIPFMLKRTGAGGYELDAVAATRKYISGAADKMLGQDFLDTTKTSIGRIQDPDLRRRAAEFYKLLRPQPTDPVDVAGSTIRKLEFYRTLWGNFVRWPMTNLTQSLATLTEVGPTAWSKGWTAMAWPEAREVLNRSGHLALGAVRQFGQEAFEGSRMGGVARAGTVGGRGSEYMNRFNGYIGALWKASGRPDDQTFRTMLAKDTFTPDARNYANDVVRRTQGFYGVDNPEILRQPIGRTALQYQAIPAKLLAWMAKDFKDSIPKGRLPIKALTYLGMTEAAQELLELGGVDLGYTLGAGLDIGRAVQAPEGRKLATLVQPWRRPQEGRLGTFSFGYGPVVGAANLLGNTYGAVTQEQPTDWRDYVNIARRELVPVAANRAWQGVEQYQAGAGPGSAALTGIGLPPPDAVMRRRILSEYEAGRANVAKQLHTEYNRAHPEAPLRIDLGVIGQAKVRAKTRKETLEGDRKGRTPSQRLIDRQPPAVRQVLPPQ
jgi:hypothetical protein